IWMQMRLDGVIGYPLENYDAVPLRMGRISNAQYLYYYGEDIETPEYASLPGNYTGGIAQGFTVSSGTAYPEAAYALAKFLASDPIAVRGLFGGIPARQSVAEAEISYDAQVFVPEVDAETQAEIDNALYRAVP